jgi:hypothetical protein
MSDEAVLLLAVANVCRESVGGWSGRRLLLISTVVAYPHGKCSALY